MKCVNCGAEIMPGVQFCHICGAPQPVQQEYNGGQQQYQQMQPPPPPYQQQPYQQQPYQQEPYQQEPYQQEPYQQEPYQQEPYQQEPYQQQPYQDLPDSNEDAPTWMKVISLLLPIVGIILWAVKKNREPVAAKSCLTWGLIGFAVAVILKLSNSCDDSDNSGYYSDYYESGIETVDNSHTLTFRSKNDVYNYLNLKTFRGDGLSIMFSNNAHSVFINGTNISNNVEIYDIGVNNNGVAYATVKVINITGGITTTFTLLAVQGHAQLIDPNDGSIYEY